MSRGKGYVKVSRLRRFLRRFPEDVRLPIRKVITNTAERILEDAWDMAPKRTGNMASALAMKVARDGLSAKVGLLTKRGQRRGFYAPFVEYGTRGYRAGSKRLSASSRTTKIIRRNVPSRKAHPFLHPAYAKNIPNFMAEIDEAVSRTIDTICSSGAPE